MFDHIEWGADGMTIPAYAGTTARHVMSLLGTELSAPGIDGPHLPRHDVERAVNWLLSLDGLQRRARERLDELLQRHPAQLIPPPGHPEAEDDRNVLRVIGIGQKEGPIQALLHDHDAVIRIYESLCEISESETPPELRHLPTSQLLASLGVLFLDRSIESGRFRETHLVQACECMAIAALNRTAGEEQTELAEQRRMYAKARWQNDPSQKAKSAMREQWLRWQMDRTMYAKPADYRAAMLSAHSAVVNEGTLKNWMTEWRKSWRPSRS